MAGMLGLQAAQVSSNHTYTPSGLSQSPTRSAQREESRNIVDRSDHWHFPLRYDGSTTILSTFDAQTTNA